jgi:uncharacterized membrane protein YphA (DoxX/SURF4 family)
MTKTSKVYAQLFLRVALAATLLSAVADRFGYWGAQSVWGNWKNFVEYTRVLTFYLPDALTGLAATLATILEITFAILLLFGYQIRLTAKLTGALLLLFALSMAFSQGLKATLDYSVWIGSAACFLLAGFEKYDYSVDEMLTVKN